MYLSIYLSICLPISVRPSTRSPGVAGYLAAYKGKMKLLLVLDEALSVFIFRRG